MDDIKTILEGLFKTQKDFWVLDIHDELILDKTRVTRYAQEYNSALLELLQSNDATREHFFLTLPNGVTIFKLEEFLLFINSREFLPDCFTRYKQNIGLGEDAAHYLIQDGRVVLNFPYKDCILQGDQTKDAQERQEVFFNAVLQPADVNNLLADKLFTGWARYSKNGNEPLKDLRDNDNLIIKGNNLLVLHSLKKRYANKVKLIYIDPPYNTGGDSFCYNDNFNHSTWLCFMKNRLEVAKSLLRDDGCIFVQCDNSPNNIDESPEFGYLLVLCDEIFGRTNYITTLVWQKKGNASNTAEGIGTITETIIVYAKDKESISLNMFKFDRKYDYKDERGKYNLISPVKTNEGEYERKTMQFTIHTPQGDFNPPKEKRWTLGEDRINDIIRNNMYEIHNGVFKVKQYSFDYKNGDAKLYNNLLLDCGSLKIAKGELEALGFQRENFSTPKPEALVKRIIEISTKPGDIVLDYHLGSGTTAAVAHKMGRQYIGVEQMDYIKTVTIERMKKVIAGESGGVSKALGWAGGGEFVYCELKEDAQVYIDRIKAAAGDDELFALKEEMQDKSCLNYKMTKEGKKFFEFEKLLTEEKRALLLEAIDPNDYYVNYSERNDEAHNISAEDKRLNDIFYKKGESAQDKKAL